MQIHASTTPAPVDARPIAARKLGTLLLERPDRAGRDYVSAASGIAAAGGAAWAVSDEYGELIRFPTTRTRGTSVPGVPPARSKPDLEAIVRLPSIDASQGAALLLALGSGSKPDRSRGAAVGVDSFGRPTGPARVVDLTELHAALDERLPLQPNIEGAAWRDTAAGGELLLFHRGGLQGDVNTIFRLDGSLVLAALRSGAPLPRDAVRGSVELELGTLRGERLGFADARALPDGRIAFVASAERQGATGDGPVLGSAIGILDADLQLRVLRPLAGAPRKVEGIERARALDPAAPADRFLLVTDPDDPRRATELLEVDLR